MKKVLRVVSGRQTEAQEDSSGAWLRDDILVVADTGSGDAALRWALELVGSLAEQGSCVTVGVHTQTGEADHQDTLTRRFLGQGAAVVRLDARLDPLAEFLSLQDPAGVCVLVGGVALRRVGGGTRIVLRTAQAAVSGLAAAEELERGAKLILGSSRDAFARYYAKQLLGID